MKKKIIISALALTIGAGLAGSITSTAAWYQYSTRTNVAYYNMAGGATGNLNVRIRKNSLAADAGWTTWISKEDLREYVNDTLGYGTNVQPITPAVTDAGLGKDDALPLNTSDEPDFCTNPVPGRGSYDDWNRATKANYIVIPLQLRYVEQGAGGQENVKKEVFLSDLTLAQRTTSGSTNDISTALRCHVSTYDGTTRINRLISKDGGETLTKSTLDLDGDGNLDTARPSASDKYGFSTPNSSLSADPIIYGNGKHTSYTSNPNAASNSMVAKHRDGLNGDDLDDDSTAGKSLGYTVAGSASFLDVDITIWVEGWQQFSSSSIWSKKYIGADFNIGFEFAVNAEGDNA